MTTFTQEDFDKAVEAAGGEDKLGAAGDDGIPNEKPKPKEPEPPKAALADTVLDGDDIPKEFRGKKLSEALNIYGTLKDFANDLAKGRGAPEPEPVPAKTEPPPKITADDLVEGDGKSFGEKFEKLFEHKVAPLIEHTNNTLALAQRQAAFAASEVLRDFPDDVDAIIRQYKLGTRELANPGTWGNIENLVIRQRFDEIAEKRAKKRAKPQPEFAAGAQGGEGAGGGAATADSLTREQRAVADGLGISYAAYAAMIPYTNRG